MLKQYDELPQEAVDRQGELYVFCDVSTCDAAAAVTGAAPRTFERGRETVTAMFAAMPEGWATSDPDKNALYGAAQFCPAHASRIPPPVVSTDEPDTDE